MSPTVLIVEDDKNISQLLKYNLQKAGCQCHVLITGEEALEYLADKMVDCIILDIMLPRMDGFETCRDIRESPRLKNIPILMLTARGEEIDRVVGLELGADDYMVKPFSVRELVLRVKNLLSRATATTSPKEEKETMKIGSVQVDLAQHRVFARRKEIELTYLEFKLLVTLMKRQGRVQSREQLLNDVWDISADVTTRTVDTHIKRLRQKLGRSGDMIETVRGCGYRLTER